ncbi:MAG: ATP-binding protein [Planctomycetes bacterium]|nr:ATP-binding protein [Planctomycetota bacterium]
MIERKKLVQEVEAALHRSPIVSMLGPRQCGKTTLARLICSKVKSEYFDLENQADRQRLSAPMLALGNLDCLIVIDEIQRVPQLFEVLRVLVDDPDSKAKFLILGSASPDLVRGISESLAGRVAFIDISGFSLSEAGSDNYRKLWLRGGFPRSFLAKSDEQSARWRDDFIRTFLERDIPQLGISIPSETLRRFWVMVAHYHGQIWNAAQFGRSLGSSEPTARRYLDILSGAYVVRVLPPCFINIKKRQVKSPKIYIRDSGILHSLLTVSSFSDISKHPKYGSSWEGFALEQVLRITGTKDAYYWATHSGAELDLLIHAKGKRIGFEFKCEDAPKTTKSMISAVKDLSLKKLFVIYPGEKFYHLSNKISVIPIKEIENIRKPQNLSRYYANYKLI